MRAPTEDSYCTGWKEAEGLMVENGGEAPMYAHVMIRFAVEIARGGLDENSF